MRVILATPIYPPEVGGPATYSVELAERLRGAHHVVVVAYTDTVEAVPSTHLISVSKKQALPFRLKKYFSALVREAKQSDLIYVQNAVAAGLPAVWAGKWAHRPVILKFVGDEAWERATQAGRTTKRLEDFYKNPEGGLRTKIFMAIQKFVLRRATLVTTPSAYLGELLIKYYGVKRERLIINYNAAAVPVVAPPISRVPHQISVACRLVSWKHIDGTIRAVAGLREKFADIQLKIAGEGPERKNLETLVAELGAKEYITFLGQISQEKARELQRGSGLHVLNSSYEGLPHEVLNSFAMETPVVATNIPGTNEVVTNEEDGLLVPVGDTRALAAAIERLFTDQALRERVVAGGLKVLKEKFSWESHIKKLEEMFKTVHLK